MRRALFATILSAAILAGCGRKPPQVETIEESGSALASIIHVADPATATQLLKGFHDIEENAWRWTQGSFAVVLRAPTGAEVKGATLVLRFLAPAPLIDRLKTVTLKAKVGGVTLPPATYDQVGDHVYRQQVPASAMKNPVTVEFELDNKIPAGAVDERELGIVAKSVGFEAK